MRNWIRRGLSHLLEGAGVQDFAAFFQRISAVCGYVLKNVVFAQTSDCR